MARSIAASDDLTAADAAPDTAALAVPTGSAMAFPAADIPSIAASFTPSAALCIASPALFNDFDAAALLSFNIVPAFLLSLTAAAPFATLLPADAAAEAVFAMPFIAAFLASPPAFKAFPAADLSTVVLARYSALSDLLIPFIASLACEEETEVPAAAALSAEDLNALPLAT